MLAKNRRNQYMLGLPMPPRAELGVNGGDEGIRTLDTVPGILP